MLTKVRTATLSGVEGYPVTVEIDLHRGMPAFNIVGLADATIREACQRIRPAIMNCGYLFPQERVTVNLVPANKPKEGSHFDLPIALGIMMLGGGFTEESETAFLGEVSLDGSINPVRGVLPLAICLRRTGIKNLVLPRQNAEEAAILEDINIIPVESLAEAAAFAAGELEIEPYNRKQTPTVKESPVDFSQVVGQETVKRAIVIGAAGNHGILMMGGPGCGKTMMAKRISTILPELSYEEKLEITGIYSVAGFLSEQDPIVSYRPFRSPHHTITTAGIIGGGNRPRPGEMSLAHRGVLFLDELGEFDARVIDAMRQPLEEGFIRIRRNMEEITLPAQSMLVIAANPCKCGNLWDEKKLCTCTRAQLMSHRRKLTGPFADRIDMHVRVNPVSRERIGEIRDKMKWESSESMRNKVASARARQEERYRGTRYMFNGSLDDNGISKYCRLDTASRQLLLEAYEKMGLTMRAYNKMMKLARTIADVEGCEDIREEHLAEALIYRIAEEGS